MSEKASQDGQLPGAPTGDLSAYHYVKENQQNHDHRPNTTSHRPPPLPPPHTQESRDFVDSGEVDGGAFTATEDDNRKMSQDSLISGSLRGSPLLRPTTHRRFQDSDSCPSVSPSPDPDSQLRTFDFSNVEVSDEGESISAALQTEREFLDFMLSLPQVQKEVPGRTVLPQKDPSGQPPQDTETQPPSEPRSPPRAPPTNVGGVVGTKMGLDHLDNLCRMMEQLGELKEQNTRLQRRVHYLEELQTLQEMHRHLQETLEARRSGLGLGPIHLSDSDLRLDLDVDGEGAPGGELSQHGSEESLLLLGRHHPTHKDQFLEPPESPGRRHSSSEDDRRVATLERDDRGRPHDKEKKGHRSAWGKVKNMISTRRDSVRKKSSSSAHRKSTSDRPGHEASGIGISVEVSAASDPEDYEVDYEGVAGDGMDSTGGMDAHEMEWETPGGVWAGPENSHLNTNSLGVRRSKPQLTITVPSSEDLSLLQGPGDRLRANQRSPETARRKVSPAQMELRSSPSLPMTPPSPRRPSNWTKVKKAFLTSQHHLQQHQHHGKMDVISSGSGSFSSLPPSPSKKNSFQFEGHHLLGVESSHLDDSYSPCPSAEVSPEDLIPPGGGTTNTTPSPQPHVSSSPQGHSVLSQQQGVQMNIADLQKSLSGEFNRRLQEWERLKGGLSPGGPHPPLATSVSGPMVIGATSYPEDNLPQEFRKKLHEWEKMKERGREKGKVDMPRGQEDVKTKIHGEDDLPADFKKKLTEWKIRKALVGESQQNVEELQKNLGEEFNRKMAEWERIKASAHQGHSQQVKPSASTGSIQVKAGSPPGSAAQVKSGGGISQGHIKQSASAGQVLAKPLSPGPESASPRLDRKGSGNKIKKIKTNKAEKVPLTKTEAGHKGRYKTDKELLWLEKELHKVERETQRLEREKEKFLGRQARLEKMRQAMGQGPAAKKEIYIKTSTGEFRFEGISQTFTKKLYEWEERRGIRPESSTIALLDPNYKAPEKEVLEKPRSPEFVRLVRSKSESSVAADFVLTSGNSHPSSLSLNEMDQDEGGGLQAENKAASEPTLAGEECSSPKVAVLVQLEEVVEDAGMPNLHHSSTPYAPAEITRNIDSSGSEEDVTRRKRADDDDDMVTHLRHVDGSKTQGSYRSLLQENMSLLDKLRQKEDLCRALEHQMGDIDSKMDNVADQHLRTLEKLHRQVTIIMKDTSSAPDEEGGGDDTTAANDDSEVNQRLINQLRARIAELEVRGDHLKDDKEQLEMAFKLHKEQETEIAESLVMRIRELQDAGAEVNIQTVQCQTDDLPNLTENNANLVETAPEEVPEECHEEVEIKEEVVKEKKECVVSKPEEPAGEKREHRHREHRKTKKAPPKKVQKLHNLTGDLLFQAKRLEQALVSKHGLDRRGDQQRASAHGNHHRQRSLRGRSSLRLAGDSVSSHRKQREATARTWSSIEAITVPNESPPNGSTTWEDGSGEGLEAPSGASTGGLVTSSRSLRLPSAVHSCDRTELLAMNAELSRMAKELRMELMKMWSFRESTSPESEASETIDRRSIEEDTKAETDRLVAEANEVFQSIALLQKDGTPPSPQAARSPSTRSRRSPSTTSLSKRRGSAGFEDKVTRRSADRDKSRSTTGTPSRRDSYRQQRQHYDDDDDDEEEPRKKEKDPPAFLHAASTLDDLLLRAQLEDDGRGWEGARRRSSDGLSTVTSGPSRSHSPSPSIASSAPDAEASPRLDDDDEDSISLTGTWKTATTSTLRSGEHMLSSSFEWEEEDVEERRKMRGKWKAVVEEEEEGEETPVTQSQPSKTKGPPRDAPKCFETEVTSASPRIATRDLKTRRISDTQVEYDSAGQNNKDDCFAYTFSRTVYDDEALTSGRLSRNPSVRRANSGDADDTHWRRLRSIPTTISHDLFHSDKSPDIFVPTKRTIFTVQGGTLNPDQARATPTFVESQEEAVLSVKREENLPSTETSENTTATKKHISKESDPSVSPGQENSPVITKGTKQSAKQSETKVTQQSAKQSEIKVTQQSAKQSETKVTQQSEKQSETKVTQQSAKQSETKITQQSAKQNETKVTKQSAQQSEAKVEQFSNERSNDCKEIEAPKNVNCQSATQKGVLVSKDGDTNIPKLNDVSENKEPNETCTNDFDEDIKLLQCEALDVPMPLLEEHSPRSSRQITPVQLPINTPMVAMVFQMSPPTSPPNESKRKVLEAANEGIPTVRNIIQKFNQRITENQELLGSPFRSPPTSPPWQSPRSQRKLLSELAASSQLQSKVFVTGTSAAIINPSSGVLKSLSTSVLMNSEIPQQVQRSASSSLVQNNCLTNTDHPTSMTVTTTTPKVAISDTPSSSDIWGLSPTITPSITPVTSRVASPTISPAISPTPTEVDTSCDLDVSIEESALTLQDRIAASPQAGDKSPSGRLRAIKIKKAKEEFLSRGAAPLVTEQRLSGGQDSVKMRHRSGTASTDDSWRDSGEISGSSPSPFPSFPPPEEISTDREGTPDRPPRTASRRSRCLKKESFRRQSAGCLLEESVPEPSIHVVKSASSGVLGSPERLCRQSIDSESRDSRPASVDPSTDSGKSARGFFRLFRRHRNRDKKDMPSVQRLCRQSLLVDFASGRMRTQSASPQPGSDSHLFALPEMDGEDSPDAARSSKTLPRGGSGEAVPPAPSRSCPSSPVAPHRSRTANWLARGRQIFKSRSPSPNKKQR